jgi:uncharacterized protein (DUF934 family)
MQRVIDSRRLLAGDTWLIHDAGEPIPAGGDLLFPLAAWFDGSLAAARAAGRIGRNGLLLQPDDDLDALAPALAGAVLVAVNFPSATDGRGFSIASVLRRRLGWSGPLRAVGPLWRDQLYALRRVGFDSFELRESEDPQAALAAFDTFSDAYQESTDGITPLVLRKLALLSRSAELTP